MLVAGLDTLVVSVYHPMRSNFDSKFGDVLERADAGAPGDQIETFRESDFEQDIRHCDEVGSTLLFGHLAVASGRDRVEFIPRMTWVAASREQLVFGAGIGPQCDWRSRGGYVHLVREVHPEDGQ